MGEINLRFTDHYPSNPVAVKQFESLIGIKKQKQLLLENLQLILGRSKIIAWKEEFHKDSLPFLDEHFKISPMILLSGDVGCGKTELASCVAGPLTKESGKQIRVYEAPSDIRGRGLVGELSGRITAAFDQVIEDLTENKDVLGILIIDEADALANSRDNDNQHHEDRAGVNTLIKELDRIDKSGLSLAVLFITNRTNAMDPAIIRRSAIEITFKRPGEDAIKEVIELLTSGITTTQESAAMVNECMKKDPLFTFSDLFRKVGYQSIIRAYSSNRALTPDDLLETIKRTNPSPKFTGL